MSNDSAVGGTNSTLADSATDLTLINILTYCNIHPLLKKLMLRKTCASRILITFCLHLAACEQASSALSPSALARPSM